MLAKYFELFERGLTMTLEQRKITECINKAINDFNDHEEYIISRDLSERCICAKFALYLERSIASTEFSEYTVDVEYNRGSCGNEYAAKKLQGRNIVVDLIVHKRGYSEEYGFDNLICIEMKKAYKHPDMFSDKERLSIMTDQSLGFGYKAGFMIVAVANERLSEHKLQIESSFYNVANCFS